MASKKNEAEVKISADLSKLNQAMRDAARSIQIANAEFKKATAGMDKWGESAEGIRAKITQLNKVLDAEGQKLLVLNDKYKLTVKNQGESSEQAKKLAVEIAKQEAKIAKTRGEIEKYNNKLVDLEQAEDLAEKENKQFAESFDDVGDKSDEATGKLEKFANVAGKTITGAAKIAGKAILGIGTAALGAGAAATKIGMSFDEQMSTVKAISGATEEEFEALREKALEMGSTTKFTATQSGEALEYMGMAGWKAQDMLQGLPGIINAAAASGEDLGTVSDIITDGLTAFGLQAEDSSHFADVLAAASANANTNIGLMGETFKYVAPMAGALKYSIDDMAVGIGLMANSGIKADQAGTSLRSILSRMAAPTEKVAEAMDKLNISLSDDDGSMRSFDELLGDLRKSFDGLSEAEKTKYANDLAGKNAMSGLLALVNASSQDYDKLTKSIRNADGAAKEMADTRLDNLQGDITIFKSALEGAAVSISNQIAPALRGFVQEGTKMIPELSGDIAEFGGELAGVAKGLMPTIKDLVGALVPVAKDIMGVIKDILPYLSQIIKSLLPPAQQLIEAIVKAAKPFIENILPPAAKLIDQLAKALSWLLEILTPLAEILSKVHTTIVGGMLDAWSTLIEVIVGSHADIEKTREEFSKLSGEEQQVIDRSQELKDQQEQLNDSLKNGFKEVDKEQGVYDRMVDRLKAITDESGNVKDGQEQVAQSIIDDLNNAFGLEMELVDGVIQKYDEQMKKLDELREKKKAQAYLDSARDEYASAIQSENEYISNYAQATAEYEKAVEQRKKIETDMYAERQRIIDQGGIFDDREWQAKLEGVTEKINTLKEAKREANLALADNQAVIKNFEEMSDAIAENDLPKMEQAFSNMKNNFIDASTGTKEALADQTRKFRKAYEDMLAASKVEGSKITEEQVNNAYEMYSRSAVEWQKLTGMTDEELNNVLSIVMGKAGDFSGAGQSLGENTGYGIVSGLYAAAESIYSTAQGIANNISSIMSNITANVNIGATVNTGAKTATGGIVTKAQTRIVGEDGAEAIVPLERNTGWIDAVAEKVVMAAGGGGITSKNVTNNYTFNQVNNSPKALSRLEIYRQSRNLLSFKS